MPSLAFFLTILIGVIIIISNINLDILNKDDFEDNFEDNRFRSNRLNRYEKKQYHKKIKHIQRINHFAPWYIYDYNYDSNDTVYWKRLYVQNRFSRQISNRKVRHNPIGKEPFYLKGNSFKKIYDYWSDIF